MTSSRRHYVVLALLATLAVTATYYGLYFHHVLSLVGSLPEQARAPFQTSGTLVSFVQKEASAAGIRNGDMIEEIGGKPFVGKRVLDGAFEEARPGSLLTVGLRHADGTKAHLSIRLGPLRDRPAGVRDWLFYITVFLLVPALCLVLGFGVATVRSWDPRAWLLLALLLSFPQLYRVSGWEGPFRTAAFAYQDFAASTFGMWLFLFGIHFPDRARWDRKRPWLKWVFVLPLTVMALFGTSEGAASQSNFAVFAAWEHFMPPLWTVVLVLNLVGVVFFICHLAAQARAATTPDGGRRARILLAGTVISCGPMFVLLITSLVRGTAVFDVAPWLVIATVLLLALFPCTLAHVIVVQRALGLRMLVRENLGFAFAPSALEILRLLVAIGAIGYFAYQPAAGQMKKIAVIACAAALILFLQYRVAGRLFLRIDRLCFPADFAALQTLTTLRTQARVLIDPKPMLKNLAQRVAEAFGISQVVVLLNGAKGFFVSENADGFLPPSLCFTPEAQTVQRLRRLKHAVLVDFDDRNLWVHRASQEEQQTLRTLNAHVLLKLADGDELFGIISVGPKRSEEPYSAADLGLLESVAAGTSKAMKESRLVSTVAEQIAANERMMAAEEADRVKSAFLARMSHELRTPLNAIIGYSELLLEQVEDMGEINLASDLKKIHWAGNHLLGLINSLLDISKIEAGKMDLYVETFPVEEVVQDVVHTVRVLAQMKGNTLSCQFGEHLGSMETDLTKVRQCLFNLVSNASKFTEKGAITLKVDRRTVETAEWIRFCVSDSGIGMGPEQLKKLFLPFTQADPSIASKYGGTGLGLAISYRFCQMMGGDITVESELGTGSTFCINLPTRVPVPKDHGVVEVLRDVLPLDARTILVVDDDPIVHDLMRRSLGAEGFRVIVAHTGAEALRKVRELCPDAITLDVMMGEMDGWAVLSELKSDPDLSDIPVIMVTMLDEKKFGFSLGANGYLAKPVKRNQLLSLLSDFCPSSKAQGSKPRWALVIDDDSANRRELRQMLQADGWKVRQAENGLRALQRMAEGTTDLILLDLSMPEMDGFWFINEIRRSPAWYSIPVVVIAAKDLTAEGRLRLKANVDHLVRKHPCEVDELLDDVTRQVAAGIGWREKNHGQVIAD